MTLKHVLPCRGVAGRPIVRACGAPLWAQLARASGTGALALSLLGTLGLPLVQLRDEEQLASGGWMGHLLGQAPRLLGAGQPYLCISVGCHISVPLTPTRNAHKPARFRRLARDSLATWTGSGCPRRMLQDSGNPITRLRP